MNYLERTPIEPLRPFVRFIWHARIAGGPPHRERILPDGCASIIVNLARDFLWECPDQGLARPISHSLVVGPRSVYEIVDSSDMADLAGISFCPGGFQAFSNSSAHHFTNRSVALGDAWGDRIASSMRQQLAEAATPEAKLDRLEQALLERLQAVGPAPHRHLVQYATHRLGTVSSVRQVSKETGWSERYLYQRFREQVGLGPKEWHRVRRFQQAVRQLHAGVEVRWPELALDCGYYDQSHFANEFRAFSGIDATTYSARRTVWANHVALG